MTRATPLDRIRAAAENENVRASLLDLIDEALPLDDLREWLAAAEALVEAVETAQENLENWRDEEDRDDRALAREEAAEALVELVYKLDEFEVWGSLPERADR